MKPQLTPPTLFLPPFYFADFESIREYDSSAITRDKKSPNAGTSNLSRTMKEHNRE